MMTMMTLMMKLRMLADEHWHVRVMHDAITDTSQKSASEFAQATRAKDNDIGLDLLRVINDDVPYAFACQVSEFSIYLTCLENGLNMLFNFSGPFSVPFFKFADATRRGALHDAYISKVISNIDGMNSVTFLVDIVQIVIEAIFAVYAGIQSNQNIHFEMLCSNLGLERL